MSSAPGVAAVPAPVASAPAASKGRLRFRPRHLWIAVGLVVTVLADRLSGDHGVGIAILILAQVLPHVPGWVPGRAGNHPVVVTLFNVLHHPAVPIAIAGAAAVGLVSPLWLVSGIAWLGHILIDWGLADGIRSADGTRRAFFARRPWGRAAR